MVKYRIVIPPLEDISPEDLPLWINRLLGTDPHHEGQGVMFSKFKLEIMKEN